MSGESWLPRLLGCRLPPAPVLVDGGANKGQVAARLLAALPHSRLHAFEPQPRLARKLAKRFAGDPRVTVHPVALGASPDTLPLTILSRPTLSSLSAPTGIRDKYAGETLTVTETVDVPVVRLDAVLDRADVIKLDLQGFELPALYGATALLPGVSVVVAETALYPLYARQALLPELAAYLEGFGLALDGLYDFFRDASGRIASGDAVFVRSSPG
jgi:FkbM family methyltransferase